MLNFLDRASIFLCEDQLFFCYSKHIKLRVSVLRAIHMGVFSSSCQSQWLTGNFLINLIFTHIQLVPQSAFCIYTNGFHALSFYSHEEVV